MGWREAYAGMQLNAQRSLPVAAHQRALSSAPPSGAMHKQSPEAAPVRAHAMWPMVLQDPGYPPQRPATHRGGGAIRDWYADVLDGKPLVRQAAVHFGGCLNSIWVVNLLPPAGEQAAGGSSANGIGGVGRLQEKHPYNPLAFTCLGVFACIVVASLTGTGWWHASSSVAAVQCRAPTISRVIQLPKVAALKGLVRHQDVAAMPERLRGCKQTSVGSTELPAGSLTQREGSQGWNRWVDMALKEVRRAVLPRRSGTKSIGEWAWSKHTVQRHAQAQHPHPLTSASTSFFSRSSIAPSRTASMPAYSIMFFRGRTWAWVHARAHV